MTVLKTRDLKGLHCLDLYYSQTNFELTYRISHGDIVVVIMAGTRENFYQELLKN